MKVLVCGSRHFNDYDFLGTSLWRLYQERENFNITEIIHGGARGADTLAGEWAKNHNCPVRVFPADWEKHGKAAGPIRNAQMLKEGQPNLVVAFLAPDSRGTKNMIDQATKAGVPVKVIDVK